MNDLRFKKLWDNYDKVQVTKIILIAVVFIIAIATGAFAKVFS